VLILINRILIVGQGSIGLRHLTIAQKLSPNADIKTFSRFSQNLNSANGVKNFDSMHDAIEFKPDIAVIANPSSMHIDVATCFAEQGVHLLIEKPISSTSKNVKKFLKLAKDNNCVILIGYNLRFNNSLKKLKELISDKLVGDIFSIHSCVGQHLTSWRPTKDYRDSVSSNKNLGGGALLELSHEIDYLKWIFGDIYSVNSLVGKNSNLDIDVEDYANLLIKFNKKISDKNHLVATLNMDFFRHNSTRTCEVIGENGTLIWDGILNTVKYYNPQEKRWVTKFSQKLERNISYINQWKHFLDCVNSDNKIEPIISGIDSFNTLKVIEAAKKSSKSGKQELVKEI
tara:strand:- start:161 stop:1189 length:1029 start_codon:yes stop_codon:yes gene_type:complete